MNLDFNTIKNTALWVLIAVAVIGIVLAIVIRKIIGKIITLVLAAVIIFFGWQQRSRVVDYAGQVRANVCATHPHFFGIDVRFPGC